MTLSELLWSGVTISPSHPWFIDTMGSLCQLRLMISEFTLDGLVGGILIQIID